LSPSSSGLRAACQTLLLVAALATGSFVSAADDVAAGRRIYMEGVLPSGKPLTGLRFGDVTVAGEEAACVKCHRRSGMGAVEGEILVAPITGNYLFMPPDKTLLANMDPRRGKSFNLSHPPYDDASLALAIRVGRNANQVTMNEMMPRYNIDDDALRALTAYLRQLNVERSPGAGDKAVRFATIVAPGAAPERRQVFVDMLKAAVTGKNASTVVGAQTYGRRHMTSAAEMVLGTERRWELDVWELTGEPATWGAQLEAYYRANPPFAVLSGLTNGHWMQVHEFCEARQLPCWFPLTDLPPVRGGDFYSLYFSRGVLLEADVLASHLKSRAGPKPARLVQIHRDDETGRAAAGQLRKAMAGSGIAVESQPWQDASAKTLAKLLAVAGPKDEVMLWLPAENRALLAEVAPPKAQRVYLSGQLASGERGVPSNWKGAMRIVYPFELPQRRDLNLSYFRQWLRLKRLPMVDELFQARLYFAMTYMTDTVAEMLDNLHRDYLLERAENMISRREGSRAQEEDQARQAMHKATRALLASRRAAGDMGPETADPQELGLRHSTTVFPVLELGPGQRFASKGAYIVRYADSHSDTLVAETPWIIP
jgi:cytochrome c553